AVPRFSAGLVERYRLPGQLHLCRCPGPDRGGRTEHDPARFVEEQLQPDWHLRKRTGFLARGVYLAQPVLHIGLFRLDGAACREPDLYEAVWLARCVTHVRHHAAVVGLCARLESVAYEAVDI